MIAYYDTLFQLQKLHIAE